ncbi:uncharacterized protein LOC119632500 [Glossina fuscipes]|uniref:Uncharacterized protein LOC119632500 n=1 Tax=Glossina fuscipes TaxID=7396 RepID=A0A8U0W8B7_9MUSC|nr:uncharacterized protein LOC119632500 [Glossina fuscipes]
MKYWRTAVEDIVPDFLPEKYVSDKQVFKMLEEDEMMEELEPELDSLEITDITDQIVNKLTNDDMEVPREKDRISHEKQAEDNEKCLT